MGKLNEIRSRYLSSETVDGDAMLRGCGWAFIKVVDNINAGVTFRHTSTVLQRAQCMIDRCEIYSWIPLIWLLTDMITTGPTTIDLDVDPPFLRDVFQDCFAHRRATDVACIRCELHV